MKVTVVTNILTPYRVPLFAQLAQQIEDCTVLLMAKQEENRQWEIESVPFKSEVLPGWHIRPTGAEVSLHFNYGVMRRLRQINPDLVLSGGFAPAHLAAFLYCKRTRTRYVQWGEFTLRDGAQSSRLRRWLRRTMIGGADACIASSSEARAAFMHYGANEQRILTAPMPIEIERIHEEVVAIKRTAEHHARRRCYPGPVLLSVGRLLDAKGCRQLFEVYQRVCAVRSDVSLLLVGDGPDRDVYERLCRERGWQRVQFVGHVERSMLSHYLALGDLFIFATLSDTFGAVLSEAMAAELPVLSSIHAAATKDLVRDGVNGWTLDPLDQASSADRILHLLSLSQEERRDMGRAAYESVKPTDINPSVDSMLRFLRGTMVGMGRSVSVDSTPTLLSSENANAVRSRLLIIGPTPPPYHGVSMAIRTMLNSELVDRFDVMYLDITDRRGIGHVNKPDWHDVWLFLRQWFRLVWTLVRWRPEIVYLVLSQSTIGVIRDSWFVWPAWLAGAEIVVHLHGGAFRPWYEGRARLMKTYTRLLLRTVARMVVLGEMFRSQFCGLVDTGRIMVVPNGIADVVGVVRPARPPQGRRRVLYLNTLNKMKGALVLLEAIALLQQRRSDVEFIFAGPWSHEAHQREAEAFIARHNLAASIHFTGEVGDEAKWALLQNADLFVFPGIQQEGQPMVVLEAMAAGLPILFTEQGCLRETLIDGESGVAVVVGDPSSLAEKMLWLLDHPQFMERIGKQARARYEREYTLKQHIERLVAVFAGLGPDPDRPASVQ